MDMLKKMDLGIGPQLGQEEQGVSEEGEHSIFT